jgi:hypothetical protein
LTTDSVIAKVATMASSSETVLRTKRKAKETSPEATDIPVPIPASFDSRPFKKPSSSSLISHSSPVVDSPVASFGLLPSTSNPPSSYASSSVADADPFLLLENNRLSRQLTASREDLAHERQGREMDRFLYEQQITLLKQKFDSTGWKGNERE